jgi:sarcosine oxidase
MRSEIDVVVAGLGVLGAAAADALARRGLSVVGLDRDRPPHQLGSSHGGSRIIRRVYPEGAVYVPLVDRASVLWRQLERRTGARLLLRHGGLTLGDRDGELISAALACARRHDLEHELLTVDTLRRRFPLLVPPHGVVALFDPAGGVLLAERCVEALLGEAAAAGAELRFDCPLLDWQATADGVRLLCDEGEMRARRLVLATGAWLAAAAPVRDRTLVVERQVQHWFEPGDTAAGPEALPPFVWALSPRRTWYGLPDLGAGVKAAIHHGGQTTTAAAVRREVEPAEAAAVHRLLERHLPHVAGSCQRSTVCLYTNTPDLGFLAGPLAAVPNVWLLGGGSGHAFKFAPALGELVAHGLADNRTPAALAPFQPARFGV